MIYLLLYLTFANFYLHLPLKFYPNFCHPTSHKCQKIKTPLKPVKLLKVLKSSHDKIFPTNQINLKSQKGKNILAMSYAQISLENKQGKLIFNNNLGNLGLSPSQQKKHLNYFTIAGHKFKAYESPTISAIEYWHFIKKCSKVIPYFEAGLPKESAFQLYSCRYYEADKFIYAKGMASLFYKGLNLISTNESSLSQSFPL